MVFSFRNELVFDYSFFVKCSGKLCISQQVWITQIANST
ncbi:hypothetical protein KCQ_18132 [Pectobacterium atrosepticum ICMP 1526]|nr:hypothetical protein KCQ_18132 [Pectobacterium atrosepticum ICMP 1526]